MWALNDSIALNDCNVAQGLDPLPHAIKEGWIVVGL